MELAILTFSLGLVLVILAKPLSDHYLVGVVGQRLVPTYAFFQSAGHITGLVIFLAFVPDDHRLLFLLLVSFVIYPVTAFSARAVCGITDYWPEFRSAPLDFILRADRYSAFGGLVGGLGAYAVAVLVFNVPFGPWVTDGFCFGLLGGEAVSRLGCHANGCCYGRPTVSNNWVVRILATRYTNKLQKAVWHGGFDSRPIYAAPLCLAVLNLIVLSLLIVVGSGNDVPAGFAGGLGLMLYPYCRLINDLLRVDRIGAGKHFTYVFLPVLFSFGFVSLIWSLKGTSPFLFNLNYLKTPFVVGILALEYLLFAFVYGGGVEFSKKDLSPVEAEGSPEEAIDAESEIRDEQPVSS